MMKKLVLVLIALMALPSVTLAARGGLPKCQAELAVCTTDLGTCDFDLSTCTTGLTICDADLGTCDFDLSTCTTDLSTCDTDLWTCTTNLTETTEELATCQATTHAFRATGQTSCWDSDGNTIDCAGTGQDGDIQAGAAPSYTDIGRTIIDNNTKLEWMKQDDNDLGCGSYPGSLDRDCLFTWEEAFAFVASLNSANHGGYNDWRVPNLKALQSILNYGAYAILVSPEFRNGCEPGCTVETCSCIVSQTSTAYWSSTSVPYLPSYAYYVFFGGGLVSFDEKILTNTVRAVRGGL